jgi:hypothetical protein
MSTASQRISWHYIFSKSRLVAQNYRAFRPVRIQDLLPMHTTIFHALEIMVSVLSRQEPFFAHSACQNPVPYGAV